MTTLPAAPTVHQTTLTSNQKTVSLVAILLAVLLASMNQTIVSTAGPSIQKALGIENSLYSWITTAYLLASTALVPIYGKLSDLLGRKVILIFGTLVFIAGSVLCGLASGVGLLILGRGVQGLGGAVLVGLMYAVIADLYPPQERSRYIGLVGAVFSLATVLGSVVGGCITDTFGWHDVFFISVPLGVIALAAMLFMPALKQQRERAPIDGLGAVLLVLFSVTLLLGLSLGKTEVSAGESGFLWGSWQILSLFTGALLLLIGFILTELRVADPIIDVRLFRNRTFAVANLTTFLLGVVFFAATVFLPLFMVNVVGLSATKAGLTTFPLTVGLVLSSIVAGQVFAKTGKMKPVILVGGLVLMLSFLLMGFTLHPDSTQAELTWKMIVVGLGLGPILPMLTIAIQGAVTPRDIGAATGTNNFLRSLGSTIGVAVLGTLFASTLRTEVQTNVTAATHDLPPALRAQFHGRSTQNFNLVQARQNLVRKLETTRTLYVAAFQNHDTAAVNALLNDPNTDLRLKGVLRQGGFDGVIREGFRARKTLLTLALVQQDPAAIQQVTADPQMPAELKTLVQTGMGGQQALGRALTVLDTQEKRELVTQPQQAIQQTLSGLDTEKSRLLSVIDKVGEAIKQSFTDAVSLLYRVGLFVTLLALIVNLFLPEAQQNPVSPRQVAEDELRSIEV